MGNDIHGVVIVSYNWFCARLLSVQFILEDMVAEWKIQVTILWVNYNPYLGPYLKSSNNRFIKICVSPYCSYTPGLWICARKGPLEEGVKNWIINSEVSGKFSFHRCRSPPISMGFGTLGCNHLRNTARTISRCGIYGVERKWHPFKRHHIKRMFSLKCPYSNALLLRAGPH